MFTAETAEVMKTLWRFQELVHSKMIPTFNKSYSLSVVLYFTRNPPNLITPTCSVVLQFFGCLASILNVDFFNTQPDPPILVSERQGREIYFIPQQHISILKRKVLCNTHGNPNSICPDHSIAMDA